VGATAYRELNLGPQHTELMLGHSIQGVSVGTTAYRELVFGPQHTWS